MKLAEYRLGCTDEGIEAQQQMQRFVRAFRNEVGIVPDDSHLEPRWDEKERRYKMILHTDDDLFGAKALMESKELWRYIKEGVPTERMRATELRITARKQAL